VFLLDDDQQTNVRWCHPRFCEIIQATPDELAGNQITGGLIGYKKGHPNVIIAEKALAIARDHRDAIVGEKWSPYSAVCMGHRHDQSILSVLTHRAGAPRLPLREFYTDKSMRDARMRGLPLYVHRGQYREMVPFADGIDEAYVINLDRRPDRMTRFGESHAYMKDRVYRWSATDGKSITLTPELTHLFRNNDFNWKKAVMGCALSHMRLWEKLANDKVAKRYLILEDDVKFGDKWLVQWMQSVKHIPEDADVIYLGGILPPNKAAFPQAIEKVNDRFGRVGLNTIFSPPGSPPRKYFHFCNYAYILTQTGARKLMHIIQQAGIFTSGDHMIVNNGNFLNIYFTTPLVATCFQEDDPVYQRSEFNNFERVDNFDSDLWNNTDKFSPEEVQAATAAKDIRPPVHSNIVTSSDAATTAAAPAPTHEEAVQLWNNFLRQVAFKHEVADSLESIFRIWNTQTAEEFNKNLNWFRIFEKLVEQKNPAVMKHATRIRALVGPLAANQQKGGQALWSKILATFDAPAPAPPAPPSDKQVIYYMPPINPSGIYETEWLSELFQKPVEWKLLENSGQLAEPALPVLLMQNIPGRSLRDFMPLFDVLEMMNKRVIVIHLSDEHGHDDIEFYGKSSVKHVLRNYWRPKLDVYGNKVTIIPLGYTNERSGANSSRKSFGDRTYVWGFAGSADREGRPQALQAMRKVTPFRESTKGNWSIPNMLNGKQYGEMMDDVKFVPCFRGMWALESYRLYEALEHGAIPIYIPSESNGVEDEWKAMYGPHPILGFPSWEKAAEMLPMLMKQSDVMERHRATLQEWWTKKKTEVKQHIASLLA
jgi:GR25 family glycosyltransferase involved in LPS biosynthesis